LPVLISPKLYLYRVENRLNLINNQTDKVHYRRRKVTRLIEWYRLCQFLLNQLQIVIQAF